MYKILATGAAVGLMTVSAHGVDIYATNNLGAGSTQTLIRFDSANPAGWVTIGNMFAPTGAGFAGLDFHSNGTLYASIGFPSAAGGSIYTVNTTTGLATVLGNSTQVLQDLSYNPADGKLYGVNSVANVATLFEVNVGTGAVTAVGNFTGLPATNLEVGLAFDAQGNVYVHDIASDGIYKGIGLALNPVPLYGVGVVGQTNFSQGMTIDWAGNGAGYHGAIGGTTGTFFSELRTFNTGGGSYTLVGNFGTSTGQFPTVETGDLAIAIPGPGAISLLAIAGLISGRRRRN